MHLVRPIFLAVLTVVLAMYAFDCGAITTPEQAMQCCNSMPCSSQGHHDQDCCKTMAAMHAPFVQPSSLRHVPTSAAVSAVPTASSESQSVDSSVGTIAAHCNAPPILSLPFPLRI